MTDTTWPEGGHFPIIDGEEYVKMSSAKRLIAQARAEGRNEGIEEAAKEADSFDPGIWPDTIAAAIRALQGNEGEG